MILTKSNTFIGEFSSNWGRIVRIFGRTTNYNSKETMTEPPVLIHDIRLAYGEEKAVPPPGW